jgi:hypothetical protein
MQALKGSGILWLYKVIPLIRSVYPSVRRRATDLL